LLRKITQDEAQLAAMGDQARRYGAGHLSYTELAKRAILLGHK
jgi:hypothetical protein